MLTGWERIAEWLATLIAASLVWVFGVAPPTLPGDTSGNSIATDDAPALMLSWAQEDAQPPIEPLDEGTAAEVTEVEVEPLDEAPPPAEEPTPVADAEPQAVAPVTDVEPQDVAPAPEEDIELLDQGAPPAAVVTTAAPGGQPTVTTTYVAPTTAAPVTDVSTTSAVAAEPVTTGPVLPPGFGTGQVHVNTGSADFPVGLSDCHVGAVTGRAYVGIDCGEEGDASFVGHAPTFQDFPFVVEGEFPFDDRDVALDDPGFPFVTRPPEGFPFDTGNAVAVAEDDADVFVAGSRNGESSPPVIEVSGASSVELAQDARDREPRVRLEERNGQKSRKSKEGRNSDANAPQSADDDAGSTSDGKDKQRSQEKKKDRVQAKEKDRGDKGGKKNKAKDKNKKQKAKNKDKKRDRR